jgi:hypothetical protein
VTTEHPSAKTQQHETIAIMHGCLVRGIVERLQISVSEAANTATLVIEVLQDEFGGERLGKRGLYLPVRKIRPDRNRRIAELMGQPPHSRDKVRRVAHQLGCGVATVWRVIGKKQKP